jgi:hypothetical protein
MPQLFETAVKNCRAELSEIFGAASGPEAKNLLPRALSRVIFTLHFVG